MARVMYADDPLYRLRVVDEDWAYGPYTRIGSARAMKTRLQDRAKRLSYYPAREYVVERVTAGSYSDPVWEEVR